MLRKILLSAVALSLVGGTAAMAQDTNAQADKPAAQTREGRGFARLDADKDGFISLEESGSRRIDMLKAADTNGDGELSQEELVAHIQKREYERRARQMSRMLDVDGDGKVTIAEIERQHEKRLALMDTNDDGQISQDEMRRAHRFMGQRQMQRGPHQARWGGKPGPRGHHEFRMHRAAPDNGPAKEPATESPAAE